jgi:hypothetical protein
MEVEEEAVVCGMSSWACVCEVRDAWGKGGGGPLLVGC